MGSPGHPEQINLYFSDNNGSAQNRFFGLGKDATANPVQFNERFLEASYIICQDVTSTTYYAHCEDSLDPLLDGVYQDPVKGLPTLTVTKLEGDPIPDHINGYCNTVTFNPPITLQAGDLVAVLVENSDENGEIFPFGDNGMPLNMKGDYVVVLPGVREVQTVGMFDATVTVC